MIALLLCFGLVVSRSTTVVRIDTISPSGAARVSDSTAVGLRSNSVEQLVNTSEGESWVRSSSLFFGACTSGVKLRIALEAPRAGRWWWISELRTPEELHLRLGARNLGVFGTGSRFADRPGGALPVAIPLDLHGGPETLFVTASDPQGDVLVDVQWVPDSMMLARLQNHAARDALILGMLTVIFLVATYLWWSVRHRAFALYAAYVATGTFWVCTKTGFAAMLLWPDHPVWNHAGPSFASRFSLALFLLFLREITELRRHFPRLCQILDIGIWWEVMCAGFALTSVAFPDFHAAILRRFTPEIFEGPTLLLGFGMVVWRGRHNVLARRIAISCLPLIGAAVFGVIWDGLNLEDATNLDTPVAIGGALLENILTTWVLAMEVRRRVVEHGVLSHEFDRRLDEQYSNYRSTISRDLHDDLSQRVLALRLGLHSELRSAGGVPHSVDAQFQELADSVRELSHQLHPSGNGATSFHAALEDLAQAMDGNRLGISLQLDYPHGLLPSVSLELFRIVQEAISNAVRHGNATRITVGTRESADGMMLTIEDNGSGIAETYKSGFGIAGIEARAKKLGGVLRMSKAKAGGTTVTVSLGESGILL